MGGARILTYNSICLFFLNAIVYLLSSLRMRNDGYGRLLVEVSHGIFNPPALDNSRFETHISTALIAFAIIIYISEPKGPLSRILANFPKWNPRC